MPNYMITFCADDPSAMQAKLQIEANGYTIDSILPADGVNVQVYGSSAGPWHGIFAQTTALHIIVAHL